MTKEYERTAARVCCRSIVECAKNWNTRLSNLAFYLQWYLGLVDYGHWKMIVDTHTNEEDKIEALKGQLSENKDR